MKKRARVTKTYKVYHLDILDNKGEVVGSSVMREDVANEIYDLEKPIEASSGLPYPARAFFGA